MGPELPDAHKFDYMVGAGYKIGAWTIDVAGMYIDKQDRTVQQHPVLRVPIRSVKRHLERGRLAGGLDVGVQVLS